MDFLIVLGAVLFSASFWLWMIYKKDKFESEPLLFLLKVMFLGGLISVIPSGSLNELVVDKTATSPMVILWQYLFVGLNEELWKLAATVYLINNHHHFDEPVDGLIYAATVALGFAAIENIQYISQYGLNVLVTRHIMSVPGHIAFAMLWGYGLALAKFKYPERDWVMVVLPFYLLGSVLHGLYNFSLAVLPIVLNMLVALTLVIMLYRHGTKNMARMLMHSPKRPAGHCTICGTDNLEASHCCHECGAELQSWSGKEFALLRRIKCKKCTAQNRLTAKFCVQCGTDLHK